MTLERVWADAYKYRLVDFLLRTVPFARPPYENWIRRDPADPCSVFFPWQLAWFRGLEAEAIAKRWGPDADGVVTPRPPIRRVICGSTGCGKTSLALPGLISWLLCCYPGIRGIIQSASREHGQDKLLRDVRLMIDSSPELSRILNVQAGGRIERRDDPDGTNFVVRSAKNVGGGAGTHSLKAMTAVIHDEADDQEDHRFASASGAQDDPQSITVLSGNPYRRFGFFYDRHSGPLAATWNPTFVSRRDLPTWTQAAEDDAIREKGGERSLRFRAEFLGLPPLDDAEAFIAMSLLEESARRPLEDYGHPIVPRDTPVVVGMDLARGGRAANAAVWRAGLDMRTIEPEVVPGGRQTPDEQVAWAVDIATRPRPPYGVPAAIYFDATGVFGFEERVRQAGVKTLVPVQFGAADPTKVHRNIRCALWSGFDAWLRAGGCIRFDRGVMRTLGAARQFMERDRVAITAKEDIGKMAGAEHLDTVDAMLMAARQPPVRRGRVGAEPINGPARRKPARLGY